MSDLSTEPDSQTIPGRHAADRGDLFALAFKTGLLTLITLGIYRFWAKTRIRKYIWSASSGDGDAFEYTGTGLEKFIGFLIAIVFLAVYLGIIQMVLFYFGLNLFIEPQTEAQMFAQIGAIYLSFFAVVPFIFFAQYRARRYKLARTRWRGIRFGAEKGAWGYVWRAIGHWFLTIVTLGILIPRQTFYLEKYMADRSWFGDAKFTQNGRWQALFPGLKHVGIGLLIMIGGSGVAVMAKVPAMGALFGVVGYIWFMVGLVYYRVFAFRYLTGQKQLGDSVSFASRTETGQIIGVFISGGLLVAVASAILFAVVFAVFSQAVGSFEAMGTIAYGAAIAGAVLYALVLVTVGALSLVWITQPIIAHIVGTIEVRGAGALNAIQQRESDTGADAEGFADALDIGGGI